MPCVLHLIVMSISEIYRPGKIGLSFELFPPKTAAGDRALFRHVEQLISFQPDFITCTYGAGGSTRAKTLEVIDQVKRQFGIAVASHLTCVGSTTQQLRAYLETARQRNIDYIVALRGDPPQGERLFRPVAGGFRYANELVEMIRNEFPEFSIAVAGYPEKHLEAPSKDVDLENLKRKVDAGAEVVITQLFYENDAFFEFRERYERMGIRVPLIPGILPITNLRQVERITSLCGATLPPDMVSALRSCDDEKEQLHVGIEQAIRQVQELIDVGVPGLHFYVLNKSSATGAVLQNVHLSSRSV